MSKEKHCRHKKCHRDGTADEDPEVAMRDHQGLPEGHLHLRSEHQRQQQGRPLVTSTCLIRNPIPPKSSITQMSKIELFTVYIPVMQKRMTRGSRILLRDAQDVGKERDKRQVEQQQDEVADVHAGDHPPEELRVLSLIIMGPGVTPWMSKAPSRIAVGGAKGMPKTKSGIKADWQAALLADSGPATPSIAPCPNSSGCFEIRLLDHVGSVGGDDRCRSRDQADPEPDPGPSQNGLDGFPEIREAGEKISEARDQHLPLEHAPAGFSTLDRTSPMPKRPMATATNSIPLRSDMEPKVKRASP